MKKLLLFLFITTSYLEAGKCFSKPQVIPDDSADEQANSDPQAVMQTCGKCNELCDKTEFVPFCSACDAQICFYCESRLCSENELFLDQIRRWFFVRTICFSCQRALAVYATNGTIRHGIMAGRIHNGEQCKQVNLFCKPLVPSDECEQEWNSCSSEE